MKRNIFLFFISFLTFFLTNTSIIFSVNGDCDNLSNVFLDEDPDHWRYLGDQKAYYGDTNSLIQEVPKTVSNGKGVCTVEIEGDMGDALVAGIITCENGVPSSIARCSDPNSICRIDGEGNPVCAEIDSFCRLDSSESVEFYYSQGKKGPESYDGNSLSAGEKLCFIDGEKEVVKTCSGGQWSISEPCSADTKCLNVKSDGKGGKMDATDCYKGCSNPPGQRGDVSCGIDGLNVINCNGLEWTEKSLEDHFQRKDCIRCEILGDNSINCKTSFSSLDGYCYQVDKDSKVIQVASGIVGGYVCLDEGQILYKCDTKIETGFYDRIEDCAKRDDGLNWCGNSEDNEALRCVNQTDYNNYKRKRYQRANFTTLSTNTNDPLCKNKTGSIEVSTAFGCIPVTVSGLSKKLIPILFGIAGGISFLKMVLGFIMIATSSGDEKKFAEAKSSISSAIIGLLVSIFAIFLFRLIFVTILKIPGLE